MNFGILELLLLTSTIIIDVRLALFGGYGEFDASLDDTHRSLVMDSVGDGTACILPMGGGPDLLEPDLACYARIDVPAEVVPVTTREDAESNRLAARVLEASMTFIHGGNPAYLAQVFQGTPVWKAVLSAVRRGAALGGTSGSVMCFGESALDFSALRVQSADQDQIWKPGLRLVAGVNFATHWDAPRFKPLTAIFESSLGETSLIAIAERTGIVGDGDHWTVHGEAYVEWIGSDSRRRFESGAAFATSKG